MKFEFEYQLKFVDYYSYVMSHGFFSPVIQGFFVLIALLGGYSSSLKGGSVVFVITAILCYILMWLVQAVFIAVYTLASKNRNVLTKHTVVFSELGIDSKNAYSNGHITWNGVLKVVKRAGSMAIYTQADAAIVIPMRVFGSNTQYQELYDFIERHRKAG